MKIFILSDAANVHTKRWVTSLAERGMYIFLFSLTSDLSDFYQKFDNVIVYSFDYQNKIKDRVKNGSFEKLQYLKVIFTLKKKLKKFKPDILHAHYASSYGFLGALSGFHPYIISVWGSDVYDFPRVSFIHRFILKYNLKTADKILSTSSVMAKETQKYTIKDIEITPFGVDLNLFRKMDISKDSDKIIIGNIKTLAPKYGIDVLIESFKLLVKEFPNLDLTLMVIGDGEEKESLIKLVQTLNIEDKVLFLGKIENSKLPYYYNLFDVFVVTSVLNSESFGVVAVESMACECPIVASDTDGFSEVIENLLTGIIVPKRDPNLTKEAIKTILFNPILKKEMGKNGRRRVEDLYDWKKNVDLMVSIYKGM